MTAQKDSNQSKDKTGNCPVVHPYDESSGGGTTIKEWWPHSLNLSILRQHAPSSNPLKADFNYPDEFNKLDLKEVKEEIVQVMKDSQDWWPADWGHYGPFFIRMAWHSTGTYRVIDGRSGGGGGNQRFAPLNSWPDNASLDKARRLLWPVKKKYGVKLSWGDLIVLAGNVALEDMGLETYGFGGGREDLWESQMDINWGSENEWLGDERHNKEGELSGALAADHMGLIYVNPEGAGGEPDPLKSAKFIRQSFKRMAMNDEETVALIAGGHTFGKAHGASSDEYVGPAPEEAPMEQQGLGWASSYKSGKGADAFTSGIEGAWTQKPTQWGMDFLENLLEHEWVLTKSPAGAFQWKPKDNSIEKVPDPFNPDKENAPFMLTTDLSLKLDPIYGKITRHYYENPDEFAEAFAKAWFKLTHRDMGPKTRYLGPEVPEEDLLWQDPIPAVNHQLINDADIEDLKGKISDTELSISELVSTAWASASTYRNTDKRGGANGARIRFSPLKDWEVNKPEQLKKVLNILKAIQEDFNESQAGNKKVSLADLIVLAGNVGVEEAARKAGFDITIPLTTGRGDASEEMTDKEAMQYLKPEADGFRNYFNPQYSKNSSVEDLLVDKAQLLNLTVPEMTVLIGGMRMLDMNYDDSKHGVFTDNPGTLSNDFYINLLDMGTVWEVHEDNENYYIGRDRASGNPKWTASRADLVFGSHAELRSIAEYYASEDEAFVNDFVKAWAKVMNLDRFDLR